MITLGKGFCGFVPSGGGAPEPLRRLKIVQQEYQHDVAVLSLPDGSPEAKRFKSGVPITVHWGNDARFSKELNGYVNHHNPVYSNVNGPGAVSDDIVMAGSSFVFKQESLKVWRNVTVSQVVERVIKDFRFKADVTPHPGIVAMRSPVGQTTWAFLVDQAKSIGYTLVADGTTIRLHPRIVSLDRVAGSLPVFRLSDGSLSSFAAQVGVAAPSGGEKVNRQTFGVNPRTQQAVYQKAAPETIRALARQGAAPIFNRTQTGPVTHDLREANQQLASSIDANRLYTSANAMVAGDCRVRPGMVVGIDAAGTEHDGLWYVSAATHVVTGQGYSLELGLGRDATGASTIPTQAILRSAKAERSALLNGQWVAA